MRGKTSYLSLLLCVPLGLIGAHLAVQAVQLPWIDYQRLLQENPGVRRWFALEGIEGLVWTLSYLSAGGALLFLLASVLGILHRLPFALRLVRAACWFYYALYVTYFYAVNRAVGLIYARELQIYGGKINKVEAFNYTWELVAPYTWMLVLLAVVHINSWRRAVINLYSGEHEEGTAPGDEIVENIRTHGSDPEFRKSVISSVLTHITVIFIIPWLLMFFGCVEDYRVPKGSGNPVVALVKIVKPKKKKVKKFILNPNSAIYFHRPDIDDSELLRQVQEETELTYRADPNARAGKMGAGGGKTGGWPDGMENHKVRFIRVSYSGRNWDDGMDSFTRADMNFLDEFHRLTGFKIARHSESHGIRLLKKYRKGFAPPFVYMTGSDSISVSASELKIMRAYLLDGGLLFADCGSPRWDRSFRRFAARLFPEKKLLSIADDDPLFQMPYMFSNGAPPLWHHGGWRALGMKHKGRWCLFYHPGDVNDAWKTGHSGLDPRLARGAFQMGVNVVYYSFTHYLEATRRYRK